MTANPTWMRRLSRRLGLRKPEPLEIEWETYQARKPELLAREGEYVVIHGREILGVVPTLDEALTFGYTRVGLNRPFLAQEIRAEDPVITITRLLF